MHVIFDSTGDQRLAIDVGEDAAHVGMQVVTKIFIAQEWTSLLRGKDRMRENFRKRL